MRSVSVFLRSVVPWLVAGAVVSCGGGEGSEAVVVQEEPVEATDPAEDEADVEAWCGALLDLRELDPEPGDGLDEGGPMVDVLEQEAPVAIAEDIALVAAGLRSFLEGQPIGADDEEAIEAASRRAEPVVIELCTDALRERADRDGTPCPVPLGTSPGEERLHDLCREVVGLTTSVDGLLRPAVSGDNALPPDGDGPDWDAVRLFCGTTSSGELHAIAEASPDDGAGRLASEVAAVLDDFLTGCRAAVEVSDAEAFGNLAGSVARLGELAGQVAAANNGDLDGPG